MIKRNDTLVVAERLMCDVAGFAGCGLRVGKQDLAPIFKSPLFYFREEPIFTH